MAILVKSDFLNEDQKEVKQLIMEGWLNVIPTVLKQRNDVHFTAQTFTDLLISCLIMFVRDNLSYFFLNSNALEKREEIMRDIFNEIFRLVNYQIDIELKDKIEKMN